MVTRMASSAPAARVIDRELAAPLSMGAVLRIGMMRRLWYAQTISVFGDFLALFAVISVLTFRLHANAQQITGVQIAYVLPITLGVLAGVFVDRWPLKATMVGSDAIPYN
jgi:DHA3 family macrolide efflux protein-like MFS transporter